MAHVGNDRLRREDGRSKARDRTRARLLSNAPLGRSEIPSGDRPALRGRGYFRTALWLALVFLAVLTVGAVDSLYIRVEHVNVECSALPPRADGLVILHLSDLHVHPSLRKVRECAGLIRGLRAHLAVITGDFRMAGGTSETAAAGAALIVGALEGRMPVYAVQGNNDYTETMRQVARTGIRVLDNRAEPVAPGVWLAGWNPYDPVPASLPVVVGAIPAEDGYILASHSPDVVLEQVPRKPLLTLAGHTHGIQIRIPGLPSPITLTRLGSRYARGLHEFEGSPLYVNRGIGTTMVPLRVYSAPEITLLTLRRGSPKGR